MRISNNQIFIDFKRNLFQTQNKISKENIRLSSGKQNHSIADNVEDVVKAKDLTFEIQKNSIYIKKIQSTNEEMQHVDDSLRFISDKIQEIRDYTIDVSKTSTGYNHFAIANSVKGLLEDLIRETNSDFNGKYLFSGTLNTPNSIKTANPSMDHLPFNLIDGAASPTNPSGLSVVFKGNNDSRTIKSSDTSEEIVNTKAEDLFGTDSIELFETIIDIYNIMAFDENGDKRQASSLLNKNETEQLNQLQKNLADFYDNINILASTNGSKLNRFEDLRFQLENENIRLSEYKSIREDTDVVKSAIELKKEENILSYALQVGSRINQISLFDFLR